MLNTASRKVKGFARELGPNPVPAATMLVVAPLLLLALASWVGGLDVWLAHRLYQPDARWAWFMREYGALSGLVITLLAAAVALVRPPFPTLNRAAAVLLVTAVLGAGLVNQVIIKELAQRPRPRDVVLTEVQPGTEIKGKSMPSGHAGILFALSAPGFLLMRSASRRQRRWGQAILAASVLAGSLVGVARMVAGAHFLSDVLVAGAISLGFGVAATEIALRWRVRVPRWVLPGILAVVAAAFVLGNKFRISIDYPIHEAYATIQLPCMPQTVEEPGLTEQVLRVELQGYGAPLSQLGVVNDGGILRLRTEYGLYHSLRCTAKLAIPLK